MRLSHWFAAFGLLSAGAALAQPGMDADGDGVITRAEYEAAAAERFERLDANGDGELTAEEFRAGSPRRGPGFADRSGERMAAIDTDGDGAWSLAEIQAVRPEVTQEQFARMDRNGDGLVSDDERPGRRGMRARPRF